MSTIKTFVGSRFFVGKAELKEDMHQRIFNWVQSALETVEDPDMVGIAVNIDADKADSVTFLKETFPEIHVVPVTPWGKFVAPLNALIWKALEVGADNIHFASVDFQPSAKRLAFLNSYMSRDTLVTGARLYGHDFQPGINTACSGRRCPWNTFAVWSLEWLGPFGFQMAGDMPHDQDNAGVEEVSTAAVIQAIYPHVEVNLVDVPDINDRPDMEGWDDDRKKRESIKIESKDERPQTQLEWMEIEGPTVEHIDSSD